MRPRNRLTAALKGLRKSNPKAIRRADVTAFPDHWRIPTGSFDLDQYLGGGLKTGGVTMFWGQKSGGKTTTAARICGFAQQLCRNCYRMARRDGWSVFVGLSLVDPQEFDPDTLEPTGAVKGTIEPIIYTRKEAHTYLIDEGYTLDEVNKAIGSRDFFLYSKGEGEDRLYGAVVHMPGGVESVPPTDEELAENPRARWGAKGWCDCYVVRDADGDRLHDPYAEEENQAPSRDLLMEWGYLDKKPPRNSKAHREAIEAWDLDMSLNSYDEVVVNWTDMEGTLDMGWCEKLGVDTKRLLLTLPDSAEEAIDLIAAMIGTMEVDLMVLDSVAQLAPKAELENSAEDWQQGLMARLMNKAIRRWNQGMLSARRHEYRPITQIWINQERVKIGVMFGSPATMPGGLGQGFQVLAEAKWWHGKTETVEEQYGSKKETVSKSIWEELHFKITKMKGGGGRGTRDAQGFYRQSMRDTDVYPAGTVLDHERILKLALDRLVEEDKQGSKKVYRLGDREYTAQSAIGNDLRDDPEFYHAVRQTLLRMVLSEN